MKEIIQSRLLEKSLPKGTIERKQLFGQLRANSEKALILVCAPAGYGKTTLVTDYITKEKIKYSWVHIQKDVDNIYSFILYISYSLQKVKPEFGKNTIPFIEDYRERFGQTKNLNSITSDIITVFINEFINHFTDDVTIVIDDLSNIKSSSWVSACMDMIFENIPSNMHFIITSREIPDFNLHLLKAKRNLCIISSDDLSFSYEETEELIKNSYGVSSGTNEIRQLKDYIGGWVTGLHLIIQSTQGELKNLHLEKMTILEDIYNYFTEDIFNNLNDETRKFLLYTSQFESFNLSLTDYIFGSKTGTIIKNLLQKNIFIQIDTAKTDKENIFYKYHTLFRKFLISRHRNTLSVSEANEVLVKASEYYLEKNDIGNAVMPLLKTGSKEKAIKLIESNFMKYFSEGHYELLWNWLTASMPEAEENASMLFYMAILFRMYKGDTEGSFNYLDRAIDLSKKSGNKEIQFKACIYKARTLIGTGRIKESLDLLKKLDIKALKAENHATLVYVTAFAHYQNGDYNKALAILDDLDNDETGRNLSIINLYGHICLIRGDYSKSIAYYEKVIRKSVRITDKFETYCNLILLYAQSGKFEKAREYQALAGEISDAISIPIFRITYLLAVQSLHFEFGDYEGAINLLNGMNKIALEINHKYYIFLSYSLIGDCYYYLNKLSKAEEYYDLAFKYVNDTNETERIQYSVTKSLLLKKSKLHPEIEGVLLEAHEFYKENNFSYNLAQTGLHLADYYYKSKNYKTSLEYLQSTLQLSREKDYISFLQRDLADLRHLYDYAAANNIEKDFIKELIFNETEKKESEWISAEAKTRLDSEAASYYDIFLKCFGKGEIVIRGTVIDDNFWTKKKWKLIFIYLLLNPARQLSKDKIIDIFYPDTQIESADNIFHQMVSKFRSIFKPPVQDTDEKGKKTKNTQVNLAPPLVSYEDKQLSINNDYLQFTDINEFEKLYKKASVTKSDDQLINLLSRAAGLYKGDFLEGIYDTWAEELRTKYSSHYIEIAEKLMEILFNKGKFDEVIETAENLNRLDKYNLKSYEYLLKALHNLKRHKMLKDTFTRLSKTYVKEYDEELPLSFTSKVKPML